MSLSLRLCLSLRLSLSLNLSVSLGLSLNLKPMIIDLKNPYFIKQFQLFYKILIMIFSISKHKLKSKP